MTFAIVLCIVGGALLGGAVALWLSLYGDVPLREGWATFRADLRTGAKL